MKEKQSPPLPSGQHFRLCKAGVAQRVQRSHSCGLTMLFPSAGKKHLCGTTLVMPSLLRKHSPTQPRTKRSGHSRYDARAFRRRTDVTHRIAPSLSPPTMFPFTHGTCNVLKMFCEETGNETKTLWERTTRRDDRTWVDFTPVTGRTHQVGALLPPASQNEACIVSHKAVAQHEWLERQKALGQTSDPGIVSSSEEMRGDDCCCRASSSWS